MKTIHLGFEVGDGAPVAVPVQHLAVTGQTQLSGKTTTLEALVSRSGLSAVAFVTKRAEGSFGGAHHSVPPYFRERADWQFVSAVLEATLRERLKFERSWIMRACKGARTLGDVHRNVQAAMEKAKGLSADVYMTLDHYLDIVIPQIDRLPYTATLTLRPGLNVMDLSAYTTELQSLVIRSVIEWVYESARGVLVIIPEAWEFIPQQRGSPVLLACEQLIRKGGAAQNFVWLDSQDIAGVHKNIVRQVGVWILGVQREANEVKRALAHIPGGIRKPNVADIMQLERGQFFACFGKTVAKVYVQPSWMDAAQAVMIATGLADVPTDIPSTKVAKLYEGKESAVDEKEARQLRDTNTRQAAEIATLKANIDSLRADLRRATARHPMDARPGDAVADAYKPPDDDTPTDFDHLYEQIKRRAIDDRDPQLLALLRTVPQIEVNRTIETIRVDHSTQPGFLAGMIADGYFVETVQAAAVVAELKRRGRSVHHTNVYRDLNRLAEQGFLTREARGYQAVPGMLVRIVETA